MKKLSKRLMALLLVVVMLVPTGAMTLTADAATSIPSDAVEFNGHYYKIYHDAVSWDTAVSNCESLGGHLATITSAGENAAIASLIISSNTTYWIGAEYVDDAWTWITGETWNYANWADGEPSYYGSLWKHRCVRIDGDCNITANNGNQYNYNKGEWDACRHFSASGHSVPLSGYVCEWESTEQYPNGYDFYEDSYNLKNGSAKISKKYFTTMFGEEQGKLLYKQKKNANGVCFGMAYTSAAFYLGLPYVINVRDLTTKSTLHIGNNDISVRDYIIYSYIYQFSSTEREIIQPTASNPYATEVYNTVKYCLNNNFLVPITMWHLKKNKKGEWEVTGGHTVLAIGIDNNKILVDDPNNKDNYEYIEVDSDGGWLFSNPWESDGVGDHNSLIVCSLNVHEPYQLLSSGTHTTIHNTYIDDSGSSITETCIEGMEKLDTDKLLMYINCDSYQVDSKNLVNVLDNIGSEKTIENEGILYWISEDKTITVSDICGNDNEIILAGNNISMSINTSDSSVVTMKIDEDNNDVCANINSTKGNKYSIKFETTDEYQNDLITTITGTASGTEVSATETDNGIQVTGLNNITVTYETADGTDTASANITDGRAISIVTDDTSNSVDFDWNCSHLCHSTNGFMQFIWKIVKFIYRIFGINQYCDCGMAHW